MQNLVIRGRLWMGGRGERPQDPEGSAGAEHPGVVGSEPQGVLRPFPDPGALWAPPPSPQPSTERSAAHPLPLVMQSICKGRANKGNLSHNRDEDGDDSPGTAMPERTELRLCPLCCSFCLLLTPKAALGFIAEADLGAGLVLFHSLSVSRQSLFTNNTFQSHDGGAKTFDPFPLPLLNKKELSSARLSPSTWGLKDGMQHNTSQSTNLPLPALAEHLVPFYTFHQWHFFPVAPQALRFLGEPLFGRLNFGSSLGVSLWGLFFGGTPLRRSPFWRVPNFGGFFFEVSSLGFLLWELLFGGLNFGGFSSGSLF